MDAPGKPVPDGRELQEWQIAGGWAGQSAATSSGGDYYEEEEVNDPNFVPLAEGDTSLYMEGLLKKRGDVTKGEQRLFI